MSSPPPRLSELTRDDARRVAVEAGAKPFHGDELWKWMTKRFVLDPARMTNLPAPFRKALAERFDVRPSRAARVEDDPASTTRKVLLELGDGEKVECVRIDEDDRTTLCLSTQVGCPVRCGFCASGLYGLKRNLSRGEILEQYLVLAGDAAAAGRRVSNVVVMGMGEPMLNVGPLLGALTIVNDADAVGLGARHITVSTVGVRKGLERFIAEPRQYTLAFSLHAPDDALRAKIVPFPAAMSVDEILGAADAYLRDKGREVTFEYVLLDGVNASLEHADALARLLRGVRGTVNLIPFNEVPEQPFRRPSDRAIDAFAARLRASGVKTTVRKRKGHDIAAACGQLRLRDLAV
ncbi:MAG TPA: 23S rRNA (adenine(2503)-C(2))-methyltransferase RlmN [Planctomycetota bacterium]|nr:23S rRNA (adenine(2503)-C(2))-methyltransferase RlmN [Planctomycetota bacterium]